MKGQEKDKMDPASYRGIYLSSATAKMYEGLLIARITQYTERLNTLTDNQIGTRSRRQIHDAIYSLLSIIQFNWHCKDLPTYVAFIDYTTAHPSVHRDSLYYHLHSCCSIRGHMWHQIRARLSKILVRVLHPNISRDTVHHYPSGASGGLPPQPNPLRNRTVAADLIRFLRAEFPDATISHAPPQPTPLGTAPSTTIWVESLFYIDDLCLMSTCPHEL